MWKKRVADRRKKDQRKAQTPVKHDRRTSKDIRSGIDRRKSMKE